MGTAQGKGSKSECIICFEKHLKGIYCESGHFVCDDCFVSYVESVFNDAGKLMDQGCKIHCPDPSCQCPPWTTSQLRKLLTPEIMERYVESLANLVRMLDAHDKGVEFDENDINAGTKVVIDSLTLGCPSCKIALDPDPEGCCAMRCGSCSKHFCYLCSKILPNSTECYSHVRICPQNPSKNVFAPLKTRESAQKRLKIQKIQQTLRAKYGPNWKTLPNCKDIVEKSRAILLSCDISPEEIFSDATDFLNPQNTTNFNTRNLETRSLDSHILGAFTLGLLTMFILMSIKSFFSSSAAPVTSCPVCPRAADWNMDDLGPLDSDPSFDPTDIPTTSTSFSFWSLLVYLFQGASYALAINYFTSQLFVKAPLFGILFIFLWSPLWIFTSYLTYIVFKLILVLNFCVVVLLSVMLVSPRYQQKKNFTVCLVLWCSYLILSGISWYLSD
jgi:hypothetical protein